MALKDIENSRDGNDAFRLLLSKYNPLITALVSRFSKGFPSVVMSEDDLRQEAAIALYLAALSYNNSNSVSFGLYAKKCIKNRLISYMRRSAAKSVSEKMSEYIDDYYSSELPANPEEQPLNLLISNESCSALVQSIRHNLTDYEYSVFALHVDKVPIPQIAERLGKSVKSVYNTLSRIKVKLRKLVQKAGS